MGVLDKLTVAASDTKTQGYDPVRVRRRKLADALQNQIGLLQGTPPVTAALPSRGDVGMLRS
jgi:hypothetical protein